MLFIIGFSDRLLASIFVPINGRAHRAIPGDIDIGNILLNLLSVTGK